LSSRCTMLPAITSVCCTCKALWSNNLKRVWNQSSEWVVLMRMQLMVVISKIRIRCNDALIRLLLITIFRFAIRTLTRLLDHQNVDHIDIVMPELHINSRVVLIIHDLLSWFCFIPGYWCPYLQISGDSINCSSIKDLFSPDLWPALMCEFCLLLLS
jgi:hypothetical protein